MSDSKIVIGTLSIIASSSGRIWKPAFRCGERDSLLCAGRATCADAPVSRGEPISSFSLSIHPLYLVGPFREVNALAGRKSIAQVRGRCGLNPRGRQNGTKGNVFILYVLESREALSIFIQRKRRRTNVIVTKN